VLKIRKYKVSDAPQIADIISKSPFGSKRYSNTKEGLKWKLNISDPEGRRLRKNTYARIEGSMLAYILIRNIIAGEWERK